LPSALVREVEIRDRPNEEKNEERNKIERINPKKTAIKKYAPTLIPGLGMAQVDTIPANGEKDSDSIVSKT
jgi:hypothetical protein